MYFPVGYDNQKALVLGNLVVSAYDQYKAFMKDDTWITPEGYTIIYKLFYPFELGKLFDDEAEVKELLKAGKKEIPIGFIASKNNEIFVVFRGTQTKSEWIRNMEADLVACFQSNYGKVHKGFQTIYTSFNTLLIKNIPKTSNFSLINITGHSLGGSLATFATIDIFANNFNTKQCTYTFGSPRTGDKDFSTTFNNNFAANSFRVENSSDLVPEVPPPVQLPLNLGGYYSHVDTPIMFNDQENSVDGNHKIATYIKNLEEAKEPSKTLKGILKRIFA
jgi:triacylglycerol lipase